ncbi:MAG: DUF6020 family protein [Oscillospiraceae bacterium]|nr:DUF6020 family protein [Oscillospiraceae bacterium]
MFPAIGVKQTPLTEALAQPLQQFGRVIVNERALTTEEEALLSKILPIETWRKVYAPSTVDPVKFHGNPVEVYGVPVKFDGDFNGAVIAANKGAYAKLWLDLLLRYPRDYIAASFDETEMLWDFFVEPGLYYPDYESSSIRLDDPLFPAVRSFEYAAFAVLSESRYTGWFHALLKPIVHFTLSLFAMLVLLKKRQKRMLLAFVPIVALWISIFLTCPLSLVGRYIYSFFLCSPILLACAFKNERKC